MKHNKIFITLALCAAIQANVNFCSEALQTQEPQSLSSWQQYAPEFMQRGTRYVSEKATNIYNTVNSWSTRTKIIVAGAIIGSLAAIYNRDQIMQWVSNTLSQENNNIPISSKSNYYPDSSRSFEDRKKRYIERFEFPTVWQFHVWTPSQRRAQFEEAFPGVLTDPAYQAAMEYVEARGAFSY